MNRAEQRGEITRLRERGTPLTAAEWDRASGLLGRNATPALLFELYCDELIPAGVLPRAVADAWGGPEFPAAAADEYMWVHLFGKAGYAVDGVPAHRPAGSVTLYRGADDEHRRGMAWTADLARARWFAERSIWKRHGTVWTAEVAPMWLLAQINGRSESEYVVDPSGLSLITAAAPAPLG